MEDNTRVLACRIDADLRLKMKEHIAKRGITVKAYVTGLIKEDLEKNAVKNEEKEKNTDEKGKEDLDQDKVEKEEKPRENKKETLEKKTVEENKTIESKSIKVQEEKQEIKKDKSNSKEEDNQKKEEKSGINVKPTGDFLKQLKQEKTKKNLEKKLLKGRNKEDEEEFE